ncbi:MAG: hypothetical protein NTY20_03190 [Candidatus Aenigmarchaeota archaeon]|nr:hypothetical protein [Candidatus Aenigmarchaeota archaeon]
MVDSRYSFFETFAFIQKAVEQKTRVKLFIPIVLTILVLSTTGTNILSDVAFRNAAASPNLPNDRTRIFVNTTNSTEDLSYQITNVSIIPVISMRLDYSNQIGGRDIVPGRNTFSFNLTLNASESLQGASMVIQARRNTLGINDSINFTSASAAGGSIQIFDTDLDGFNDRVSWSGNLPPGDFNISFTGNIIPGVNFDENLMYMNLDEGLTYCIYVEYNTFTGITFSNRFSRGPIREGVEMVQLGTWVARGFIKNIAADTTYILSGWELYEIGNPVPVLNSSLTTSISPGDTRYTDWYDSGLADKPAYFSGSFNWEVVWGTSTYRGISTSTMDMPVLYEMDSWSDGTAVLQSNTAGGRSVAVNITTRHLGYSGISINSASINSTLPRFSFEGVPTTWTPSSIRVYYSNGTGTQDITPFTTFQTQNSGSGDGFVYAEIPDILSATGHYMQQNDNIILSYIASSPASSSNQNYTFATNTTLVTLSGTPVTKRIQPYLTIPGVVIPAEPGGGGGGGGGPPAAAYADIVKESADAYFVTANIVRVIVIAGVIDSGDKGIKDVKVLAYVPKDASLDTSSAALRIYRNSTRTWEELALDKDFMVVDRGLTKIGKDEYREYLIKKVTPAGSVFEQTIDMRNGDKIEVNYKVSIPFGTSYLLTRIFGYNYYQDKLIFEDAYTPVRRELSQLERLQIEEDEWFQGEALVGRPVKWTKFFRIYNPNNVSVEEVIATKVFQDSLNVELAEAGLPERTKLQLRGGNETLVNWYARLGGNERKTYMIEADTPPVLETRREITVLESNRTSIRIIVNMTMENFARERYSNVTLLFPVKKEKIIMISDPTVTIEEFQDNVKIIMPGFNGLEVRSLSIMYVETPPMLATTLNAIKFSCSDSAKVTIIVVPSEAELDSYIETEVVGPEPNLITSHVEIVDLKGAKPYQEIRIPIRISLSSFPSGKYFVYTKFNRNFVTILSDKKEFTIDCPGRDLKSVSWMLVLAASFLIVGFLAIRVYRKRSYEKELAELRKKVKEI